MPNGKFLTCHKFPVSVSLSGAPEKGQQIYSISSQTVWSFNLVLDISFCVFVFRDDSLCLPNEFILNQLQISVGCRGNYHNFELINHNKMTIFSCRQKETETEQSARENWASDPHINFNQFWFFIIWNFNNSFIQNSLSSFRCASFDLDCPSHK